MSASLVGSEMCIRDRTEAIDGTDLDGDRTDRTEHLPGRSGFGTAFCVLAVSYTHLTLPTICSE
eukprot:8786531-Alexandrium_andersonii.AAC.1